MDDRDGNQFKVTVFRAAGPESANVALKNLCMDRIDPEKALITCLIDDSKASYAQVARVMNVSVSTVKRLLQELKH